MAEKYKPKFSIWVINYNKPDLTLMTLRSCRTRNISDLCLVNTGEVPCRSKYRDIFDLADYSFRIGNESLAKTWNWIMENSLTEYNIILNNDVLLSEYAIDVLWRRKKMADVVSMVDISPEFHIDKKILPYLYVLEEWPKIELIKPRNGLAPEADFSAFMISKAIRRRAGKFCEDYKVAYFEDMDFKQRMFDKKLSYCGVKSAMFYHIGQQSSDQNACFTDYYQSNQVLYQRTWRGLLDRTKAGGLKNKVDNIVDEEDNL